MSEEKTFCGDSSREFWDAVKRAGDDGDLLYDYGCKAQELEAENKRLTEAMEKTQNPRISNSCLPCMYLGGDCCGVLYWADEGKILCNECGREFDVEIKHE